mgnify:FL=1
MVSANPLGAQYSTKYRSSNELGERGIPHSSNSPLPEYDDGDLLHVEKMESAQEPIIPGERQVDNDVAAQQGVYEEEKVD